MRQAGKWQESGNKKNYSIQLIPRRTPVLMTNTTVHLQYAVWSAFIVWVSIAGKNVIEIQDCPAHYTTCLNATVILPPHTGAETKQYIRGCNIQGLCKSLERATEECKKLIEYFSRGENITCDATCCTEDLCNESAVMMTSSIMLIACVTWVLAR